MVKNEAKHIQLCFGTCCAFPAGLDSKDCEEIYQNSYKPLVSALYNLPEFPFSIALTGIFCEWVERHHPEFFMILEEMTSRKQIEILGGGYYSPLFPFLPPIDRVGQIEMLTTAIRKNFGKRPRGAWLPASAWEPSMIASLTSCCMEYVLIDRLMIETSDFPGVTGLNPVILEDSGKTIIAVPMDNTYRNLERFSVRSFIESITGNPDDQIKKNITVFIERESIDAIFTPVFGEQEPWITQFYSAVQESESKIMLSTPGQILKSQTMLHRAFLPSGMSPYDYDKVEAPDDVRFLARTSVKYLLLESDNVMNIYAKMMYVHSLVTLLRGDKARRKTGKEELWKAQNEFIYRTKIPPHEKAVSPRQLRLAAYKNLLAAERMSRLRGVFAPSIHSFDFDLDGLKEYLCQLENLNFYIHPLGGRIFELDILSLHKNYSDVDISRSGLFIDHLYPSEESENIENGTLPDSPPVFAKSLYQELSVDAARHEVSLRAAGFFGIFQQPVSLKKTFSFRNEGIQVQYILKNDSPFNISGIFLIEIDLALQGFKNMIPTMAAYAQDNRIEGIAEQSSFSDLSWIRLDDPESGSHFTFEANENPQATLVPILDKGGVRLYLYWKVELGPNFETEKMLFLKIDA